MKKLISIMLILVLAAGTFAIAGCGNDEKSSDASGDSSQSETEAEKKLETAKVSKFEAYLTYDPDEYVYDADLLELFYKADEDKYIYGAVFDGEPQNEFLLNGVTNSDPIALLIARNGSESYAEAAGRVFFGDNAPNARELKRALGA